MLLAATRCPRPRLACTLFLLFALTALATPARADFEPDALMLRFPDVSAERLVFTYDGNLWVAPKDGGTAAPLTITGGVGAAKFSPDGQSLAYTANYDGSNEVYAIPARGGVPKRLTWSPQGKTVTGFTPEGRVAYITYGELPHYQPALYSVSPQGGTPQRLPVFSAANNSFSADGQWLAFCPWTREGDTWNRYMGGTATDIWLFNLQSKESQQLTDWGGTDDLPMFDGNDRVFYLSDAGPEHRRNIWVYGIASGERRQVTHFTQHETKWPSIGPSEIALENGGVLYLLSLGDLALREVHPALPGDRPHLRPYTMDPSANLTGLALSPTAKRVAACLRGDIWTFPAEHGFPQALTRSDSSTERDPAWSPDGKSIVYLSDVSGEYELYLRAADGGGEPQRLTTDGACFRYSPEFSPDSKKLCFSDKTGAIWILVIETKELLRVDLDPWGGEGLDRSWAKDSNWLAFTTRDEKTGNGVVKLYSLEQRASWPMTSPMFNSGSPAFDLCGDYLYFATNRSFNTSFNEAGDWGEYYFANTTVLAVAPLRSDVKTPWAPKNDVEEPKKDEAKDGDAKGDEEKGDEQKGDDAKPDEGKPAEPAGDEKEPKDGDKPATEEVKPFKIDVDGIEARTRLLPLEPGQYYNLAGGDKKLYYIRAPRSGSNGGDTQWCFYDMGAEPKETVLLGGVEVFGLTPDAAKALVAAQGGWFITAAAPGANLDKRVNLGGVSIEIDPRAEWREVVTDVWRIYRDFFYDPGMHGVDWPAVKERSLKLVDSAASRADVNYIISELVSDISSSHTYVWDPSMWGGGGVGYGLLGCDFEPAADGKGQAGWRIKRILRGGPWDLDVRSPLSEPGVAVAEGEFILAVNGQAVDAQRGPYALLTGCAGRPTELTLCANAVKDGTEHKALVTPTGYDGELRLRDWIERTRQYISDKSGGKIGYIYVRDTADSGMSDFQRQFTGQHEMDALVIDERWNGGGYSPEFMLGVLAREPRSYWAVRDGKSWRSPQYCHPGPQVLLINEHAGSGGDNFPWLWRRYNLGPIIGTRTWGGLIGISGNPQPLDGSGITVPTFGIYDVDGSWAVEGHGVDPDVPVVNDPTALANGVDKQVDKAIELLLAELAAHPVIETAKPPYPDRSGMGVPEQDW